MSPLYSKTPPLSWVRWPHRATINGMKIGGHKQGFTIVELLIVVVVIAILAVITMVTYVNFVERATKNRAISELSAIARAVELYHADKDAYPADVERNIPVGIFDYSGSESVPTQWPIAPWPGSVYDYDYFTGTDGNDVVQISIRFCPLGGPFTACRFPNEPWAAGFDLQSSAYWCITGGCRAHPNSTDDHPAYCINCHMND